MDKFILVPTDFSEAADNALKHAIYTAKQANATVYLLNLCKSSSQIDETKNQLKEQADKVETKVNIECIVRVGSFKDIPLIGKELSVDFIFMGTHGANGMQKILGLNALKLVSKSDATFIIVQKNTPLPSGYKTILVPISFYFESKQKIKVISSIAQYFGSLICFIYQDESDSRIKAKVLQNLKSMKTLLDNKGLKYEVKTSSGKNFNADTLSVASEIGAELIAIMNMQKDDLIGSGLLGQNYEQELIMNDQQIPIMILNPNLTRLPSSVLAQ